MIELLTTAVQNLSEPKIDTKSLNQTKKADESSPFGECLKSVETTQNKSEDKEKLGKEKSNELCAQVYVAATNVPPVIITLVSTASLSDVTLSAAPAGETGISEVEPPALNAKQEGKLSDLVTQVCKTENPVNSAKTVEALADNYLKPVLNKTEKAVPEKSEVDNLKIDILPIPEKRIETANNDKDNSQKSAAGLEPLTDTNNLKSKEVLPQALSVKESSNETIYENTVQIDAKPQNSMESKPKTSESGIKLKADEQKPISISVTSGTDKKAAVDVKTPQSKTSDTSSGEKKESLSVPEKEALPKKAIDTVKTEASEALLTGAFTVKENKNTAAVSGENITAQIVRAVKEIKRPDNTRLTVELAPKELGKITVEMKYSEGKLNLVMNAESKETAKVLSEQIGQLKTALAANKVEIQTLDVSNRPHIDLAFSNMNSSGGKFSGEDKGAFQNRYNYLDFEDEAASEKPLTYSKQNQLLNYLA